MSLRFNAINNLSTSQETNVEGSAKITAIFNEHVFTLQTARQFLSDEAFNRLTSSIKAAQKIDRDMDPMCSKSIRACAESKVFTHFTHLFQPLTGTTAEKHDS